MFNFVLNWNFLNRHTLYILGYSFFVLFHTLQLEKDYDTLTIYDEANDYNNPIKKLSGNLRSFGVSSSGNVMYIKFESDSVVNDFGFLATFYYGNKVKPSWNIFQAFI